MNNVDVVIVGGGMVGLTCALTLSKLDLTIAVVDAAPSPELPTGDYKSRVSAINHGTKTLLQGLNAWPESQRLSPYVGMHVWDKDSFSEITFNAKDMGHTQLGTIVENDLLRYQLWQQVQQAKHIKMYSDTSINQWAQGDQQSFINLSSGDMLTAKLVVGADGAESMVRKQANFALTHWDYDHHAIVATVKTEQPHGGVARQAFTPEGPLALLPLDDPHYCSIVWSQQTDTADHLMALDETAFNQALMVACDITLGEITLSSQRHCIPLKMRYARQWANDGVVLIGDAAHTFHPLAGLGANTGFMDAAALAQEIEQNLNDGKPYYQKRHLRGYERWRKAEAVKTIALMEGLKRLFDGQSALKKLFRGLGMSGVNQLPVVKKQLMDQAMGISGKVPVSAKNSE